MDKFLVLIRSYTVSVKNIETKSQKNWDKKSKKIETYKKILT